jgi:hypothetical protein
MALPSAPYTPAPQQPPTPGVGLQGAPPVVEPLPVPDPVLFADIDPVLLVRLYPDASNAVELRSAAMAAGEAAKAQGEDLLASQQEPILLTGTEEMLPSPMPWQQGGVPAQPQQPPQAKGPQRPPQYPPSTQLPYPPQYPGQGQANPYPPQTQYPQQP